MTLRDWLPILCCLLGSALFFGASVEFSAWCQRKREREAQHRRIARRDLGGRTHRFWT